MLILSRKIGERIQIGDNVTVFVNQIFGNRVLIGIDAPKEINIKRGELVKLEPPKPEDDGDPVG